MQNKPAGLNSPQKKKFETQNANIVGSKNKVVSSKNNKSDWKYLVIDTETTGLDPKTDLIHQISGCIIVNAKIVEFFDFNINIDDKYYKENGLEPKNAYQEFVNILDKYVNKFDKMDKFFLLGYNVTFDKNFLEQFFKQNGNNYFYSYIWGPNNLDVMTLASFNIRKERRNLKDFKQGTVAEYLGINVSTKNLHNSLYDIIICIEIFCIVTGENIENIATIYLLKSLIQDDRNISIWEINQMLK